MSIAHINRISTAHPAHDVHEPFLEFMGNAMPEGRPRQIFQRMARRSGIGHRYSVLHEDGMAEADTPGDAFYRRGAFPSTGERMRLYARHAPTLAAQAVQGLNLGADLSSITHLVVASCTGFIAPGLDQLLARQLGLRPDLQRTLVGFMGCSAAVPALRVAQATVLADPQARVLVVNLELCTLHMQETDNVEIALSFMLFGDGCSAALVSAEEQGIALGDFRAALIPDTEELITWHIGDQGFVMHLSGQVPGRITQALRDDPGFILRGEGTQAIDLWAVHGGGRTVLDAVQAGFALPEAALAPSRAVLAAHGNMSSATVMFVLAGMMERGQPGQRGLAMAFGPGMVAETFRFSVQ